MRFGISATSLICPKNLRTRLRPVNVCCAIVASHFVARQGRTFRSAIGIAPGLNPDTSPNSKSQCQVFIRRPDSATFRTQNDARSRSPASPVSTIRLTDRKSPKFAYLPTAYAETSPFPPPNRAFVLPSRYGMAIVEIRGVTQRIPTQSCVQLRFHLRGDRQGGHLGMNLDALLEFDLRAGLLELRLDLLGLVLVDAFLDSLRRALDEV